MDEKLKNSLMISIIAANLVIVVAMIFTGYNYWISIPSGLVVGGGIFGAMQALT